MDIREGWIIHWEIEEKKSGQLIGTCFLSEFQDGVKAKLCYELSLEYWNRGIMSEIAQCIIDYGFQKLSLVRIQAICSPDNDASQNILEKPGFEKEGLLRKYEYHTETKELRDVLMYSRIQESS